MSDARRTLPPQSPPTPRARRSAEAIIAQYIHELAASTERGA